MIGDRSSGNALLGEELLLVGLAVESRLNRLLARGGGPSLLQLRVLALLALEPDIEPRDAARALAVHPASLHHTLQQLILVGSVSQEPHPADGRRRLLRLTERGREEYALLRRPVEEDLSSLTEHLSEPEQRRLAGLLGQLRERLALVEDGSPPEPRRPRARPGP